MFDWVDSFWGFIQMPWSPLSTTKRASSWIRWWAFSADLSDVHWKEAVTRLETSCSLKQDTPHADAEISKWKIRKFGKTKTIQSFLFGIIVYLRKNRPNSSKIPSTSPQLSVYPSGIPLRRRPRISSGGTGKKPEAIVAEMAQEKQRVEALELWMFRMSF